MANEQNLKPFVKGDPRISRKGRPKSFDALRALAVSIAREDATDKNGNVLTWNGRPVTYAEFVLRSWVFDKRHQKDFIEAAFGKVPDKVDVTTDGKIIVKVIQDE